TCSRYSIEKGKRDRESNDGIQFSNFNQDIGLICPRLQRFNQFFEKNAKLGRNDEYRKAQPKEEVGKESQDLVGIKLAGIDDWTSKFSSMS
ncbi:hypothetical protein FRX31_016112, partial [Thalictrum thalictroides]